MFGKQEEKSFAC